MDYSNKFDSNEGFHIESKEYGSNASLHQEVRQLKKMVNMLRLIAILLTFVLLASIVIGVISLKSSEASLEQKPQKGSAEYYERMLKEGDWTYISIWSSGDEYRTTARVKFYSNGKVRYFYPDGSGRTYDWEILEDKTLLFDGVYYEYGEWYCEDGDVVIGDNFKCTENPKKYPERD